MGAHQKDSEPRPECHYHLERSSDSALFGVLLCRGLTDQQSITTNQHTNMDSGIYWRIYIWIVKLMSNYPGYNWVGSEDWEVWNELDGLLGRMPYWH